MMPPLGSEVSEAGWFERTGLSPEHEETYAHLQRGVREVPAGALPVTGDGLVVGIGGAVVGFRLLATLRRASKLRNSGRR